MKLSQAGHYTSEELHNVNRIIGNLDDRLASRVNTSLSVCQRVPKS